MIFFLHIGSGTQAGGTEPYQGYFEGRFSVKQALRTSYKSEYLYFRYLTFDDWGIWHTEGTGMCFLCKQKLSDHPLLLQNTWIQICLRLKNVVLMLVPLSFLMLKILSATSSKGLPTCLGLLDLKADIAGAKGSRSPLQLGLTEKNIMTCMGHFVRSANTFMAI